MNSTPEADFERERLCYEQNFLQFRSLNQIMWQVPVIAMTLTGGLWFGAATVRDIVGFQIALLLLAAMGNLGLIIVLTRVRYVMKGYLQKISAFNERLFVSVPGDRWYNRSGAVMRTFRTLLLLSALISLVAIALLLASDGPEPSRRVLQIVELDP